MFENKTSKVLCARVTKMYYKNAYVGFKKSAKIVTLYTSAPGS